MNQPMISVSGIRGLVNDSFSEELVRNWTRAFGMFCLKDSGRAGVVIGRDTRQSGAWAENIIATELRNIGILPIMVGIVPTPTVELAVTHHQAKGGIIITASHNPIEWNGLKFLGSDGVFLDAAEIDELKSIIQNGKTTTPETAITETINDTEAITRHIEKVLLTLPIDVENIRAKKFKVVLDPVNGAGAIAVPALLEKLGCETVTVHGEPSGIFGHTPEPRPENLSDLSDKVKETKAVIGFAVDPDADRLALIDENGIAVSEEYTLALAALAAMPKFSNSNNKFTKTITINLSTSRMIDDVAKIHGFSVSRSAVGEVNVVKEMRKNRSYIGGEGNGGIIFPACHEGRDSLVGIALILNLLAEKKPTVSEITATLPKYFMVKEKYPIPPNFNYQALKKEMLAAFNGAALSDIDGIRVDTSEGWTQIRASNTEPIVRIITEAASEENFSKLSNTAKKVLSKL